MVPSAVVVSVCTSLIPAVAVVVFVWLAVVVEPTTSAERDREERHYPMRNEKSRFKLVDVFAVKCVGGVPGRPALALHR